MNGSCHYSTMPKNYKQGALYDIRCNQTGRVYVGSRGTTEEERMNGHRKKTRQYVKNKSVIGSTSVFVLENGHYEVHTIESYPCECDVDVCTSDDCKKRLEKREGEYIRQYKEEFGELCVNKEIAGRTIAEYREDNHPCKLLQDAVYRDANREAINQRCLQWYHDNKEKVSKKVSAPTACVLCGTVLRKDSIPKHMRSCFKNSCDSMNLIEI